MKNITFKNCSPLKHGWALQHLSTYMQDIGEVKGSCPKKIYGGRDYITVIRQTKSSIFVEIA